MAKPIDLLELPSRLYPTIKHSLCLSRSVEVSVVTQDKPTLCLIRGLWQHLQDSIGLYIPFVRHTADCERPSDFDTVPEDYILKIVPPALHQQPLNRWINSVKLLATAFTPSVHIPPAQRNTADVRAACKALAHAIAVYELISHAPASGKHGIHIDSQMAFETETVSVIISDDLIVVPRLSKSFRDFMAAHGCDPTFEQQARQQLSEESEAADLGDGSVDVYDLLQPTFDMCESILILKSRAERKQFLGHLLDLIIFESGIDASLIQRPSTKARRSDIGRAGGALNLTTLRYIASSCPLPGLAPSMPSFLLGQGVDATGRKCPSDIVTKISLEAPLLPIQLAKLAVALHHMAKVITASSGGTDTCVKLLYQLTDTTTRIQNRMKQAVDGVPAGVHFTHAGVSAYLKSFRAWAEIITYGSIGMIITRRAVKEREKLQRLSQCVEQPSVTPKRRPQALTNGFTSEMAAPPPSALTGPGAATVPARRRAKSGGRARPGMRIVDEKGHTAIKDARVEEAAEAKRLDHASRNAATGQAADLEDLLPEALSAGCHTIRGFRVFCLGRFPHLQMKSASFTVFWESASDSERFGKRVAPSPLMKLLLSYMDVFVISAYLYDEYRDGIMLTYNSRVPKGSNEAERPAEVTDAASLYACLYGILPKERCRSPHWLMGVARADKYFPDLLRPGPPHSWFDSLPRCHALSTCLNDSFTLEGGTYRDAPIFSVVPSRGLFLLASPSVYTIHDSPTVQSLCGRSARPNTAPMASAIHPDTGGYQLALCSTVGSVGSVASESQCLSDEAPWTLGANSLLAFPSREALGRICRSPTRNVLLTGVVSRALLRPLLDAVERGDTSAPRIVRVMVVVPRGIVADEDTEVVDPTTCAMVRNYIAHDLAPLLSLQREFGASTLQVEMVSHAWVEECYLQGEGVDYRPYVVSGNEGEYLQYVVEDREGKRRMSELSICTADVAPAKLRRMTPS